MIEEYTLRNDEIKDVLRDELDYLSRIVVRNVIIKYEENLNKKGISLGQMFKDDLYRKLKERVDKTVTLKLKISIEDLDGMEFNEVN